MGRSLFAQFGPEFGCQGLNGRSGHVKEQLSEVRAASDFAQVLFNLFAPTTPNFGPNHFLHGVHGIGTLCVWEGFHVYPNVLHHQLFIDGQTDDHLVNGLVCFPGFLTLDFKKHRFGIGQLSLNIPQSILAVKP